jgi:hypothetical protein
MIGSIRKLLLAGLLSGAILASAAPQSFSGVLTDDMCGQKHMMPGKSDAECTRECVKAGSKYALAVGGKIYTLSGDAKQFDSLAGKKVTVKGEAKGNTIAVTSISAAK